MMKKKFVSLFEASLMIVSLFAFGYFLSFDIPFVSAQEPGCCSLVGTGEKCATATQENCIGVFAEGAVCSSTSFCQKGCCYDSVAGIFDKNVLKIDCSREWAADPNCNMPAADLGCCVLGDETQFETEGMCRTDTLSLGLSNLDVDWRSGVGEVDCLILSASQEEGACVLGGGRCEFSTEVSCLNVGGDFYPEVLCTSSEIDSDCERTSQTTCVDGKDGVYFVDSCGNPANIYDASRVDDINYWEKVVSPLDSCGFNDEDGGANSKDCGNCDRFAGGICGSAIDDDFNVDEGDFYCRETSCTFEGENYENGESWCVYDGAIGEGNDVVGSRHWKYVCNQGVVNIEPCADYRNQICVQSSSGDFDNAACVTNNWRECLSANNEDNPTEACGEAINCYVDHVGIGDQFSFDVCLPKYPAGFSLSNERYQESARNLCDMASQKCTVIRAPKKWGGCEIVKNAGCLTENFAQEMNEFCDGIGDCGGSVNIVGDFSSSYSVSGAPGLSSSWIASLTRLSIPVLGQYAVVEDYSEYLEAAGWKSVGAVNEAEDEGFSATALASGVGGLGIASKYAIDFTWTLMESYYAGGAVSSEVASFASASQPYLAGFAGAAMGAAAGMMAGAMIAQQLGLSEGGTLLMTIGGALVGGAIGYALINPAAGALFGIGPVGWAILIVGVVLMIIGGFFGGSDCPPIDVTFTCKTWKPVSGAEHCEECNENALKPCSEYRCESLGAGCVFMNEGTEEEICISSFDDGLAPVISPQYDAHSENLAYGNVDVTGFGLTSTGGGCFNAYEPLVFGVSTNELAYCKFDVSEKEFGDMSYDLGSSAYTYNHTTLFTLPDPSHGQSQGANWSGDLTFYIKCEDAFGTLSNGFYRANMCVNQGPDVTGPRVVSVSPSNGGLVGFNANETNIQLITNELANCSWSPSDVEYSGMMNKMDCEDTLGSPSNILGYVCTDSLGIGSNSTTYYVNCVDQPWGDEGNTMDSNYVYVLNKPSKMISIDVVKPDVDFEVNTDYTTFDLSIVTSGGGNYHTCSYSLSGYDNMIEIFETGGRGKHVQNLNLPIGDKKIYVECKDETGEFVRDEVNFEIIKDVSAPQIARVWQSGGMLYVVTVGRAECKYSQEGCRFDWESGVGIGRGEEHSFSIIRGETYFVKCEDEFGNAPSGCSLEVKTI